MKIVVSFKEVEKILYDHAKGKMCPSAYVKELIKADMESKEKSHESNRFNIDI
ncbi:hypothetical protein [Inconstantimicrobium porci]|uniref:hypothetical protein n=1 Tax=Inconstantimicrobium porci TaxID=2652291 RepID=UPI0012B43D1C|nr:hypothetical protein [Inconstantimicrobium porci]